MKVVQKALMRFFTHNIDGIESNFGPIVIGEPVMEEVVPLDELKVCPRLRRFFWMPKT